MPKIPRSRRIILTVLSAAIVSAMTGSVFALTQSTARPPKSSASEAIATRLGAAGAGGVEAVALDFAVRSQELPTRDGAPDDAGRYCDPQQLRVIWTKPSGTYLTGAFIEPLGPPPDSDTTKVNGIVVCEGSSYTYMGFEALRSDLGWEVIPIPVIDGDEHVDGPEDPADTIDPGLVPQATLPLPTSVPKKPATKPAGALKPAAALGPTIETYSGYDAQNTCSPKAKPGVLAFRKMVLAANPQTRSLGITRGCSIGGRSEHKEGRAWDWGANVNRPAERAAAEKLIKWLFATDEYGNKHAMARRLGIMYIVYNRKIWGAYRTDEGWRPYHGASPHTDHAHFSFAWPGAQGKTSFWTGKPAIMPGGSHSGGGGHGGGGQLISDRNEKWQERHADWQARHDEWKKQRDEWMKQHPDWNDDHDGTPGNGEDHGKPGDGKPGWNGQPGGHPGWNNSPGAPDSNGAVPGPGQNPERDWRAGQEGTPAPGGSNRTPGNGQPPKPPATSEPNERLRDGRSKSDNTTYRKVRRKRTRKARVRKQRNRRSRQRTSSQP
jgi:hypothetical protein